MTFEYMPGETWLHRLDPRTKILLWITIMMLGMSLLDPIWDAVLFLFVILILRSGNIDMDKITSFLKSMSMIAAVYVIFNILFPFKANTLNAKLLFYIIPPKTFPIYVEVLVWTVGALLRFLIILLAVRTVLMLTPMRDVIYAFVKLGLPPEFGLAMTSAFGFLPAIIKENSRIKEAQMVRGWTYESGNPIERAKALFTQLLIPAIYNSIRQVQSIALAIESRGFSYNISARTYMTDIRFRRIDYLVAGILLALIIFGMLARTVFQGMFIDFTIQLMKKLNLY